MGTVAAIAIGFEIAVNRLAAKVDIKDVGRAYVPGKPPALTTRNIMAKKSRTKTRTRSKPSPDSGWGSALVKGLFQPGRLLVLAAAIVTAIVIRITVGWLPDLAERDEYIVNATTVEVTSPPRMVPPNFVQQAFERSDMPEQMSLLDESVTQRVHDALQRHPWVAEVSRVSKQAPGRIVADLKYRRPIAMVEVARGVYPIDPDGTLLPPADFTVSDAQRYPLVEGVVSTPQGPEGTNWGDPAVNGAADLATLLESSWEEFQLEKIHCRPGFSDSTPAFELISRGGSRIMWGCAPAEARPGEPDAEQKIQRLRKYLKHFGNFEKPDGPYEIDIRHWQEISRTPLTVGLERSVR